MNKTKLLILTTGGTIGGRVEARADRRASEAIGRGLSEVLEDTISQIADHWEIAVELNTSEIADVDSSDIVPGTWVDLINEIHRHYDDYDGFVVTHGTNTMGYSCAALSFGLGNLDKPVVVTGSQVPFGWPGSDALINLDNAIRVATVPDADDRGGVRGVVCVFGSHIITGTRAKKNTEFDYDAFQSFSTSSLGRIGRTIAINASNLDRHHEYLSREAKPAECADDLIVKNAFDPRLLSFTEFPGMSPAAFRGLLEPLLDREVPLVRGIVFRGFGAGDVSTYLHPTFRFLKENEIPIVVTTQAPNGSSNFAVNEPGMILAREKLAIPAHDMSIESMTIKLMWLLGQDLSYSEVSALMLEDMHGEITKTTPKYVRVPSPHREPGGDGSGHA